VNLYHLLRLRNDAKAILRGRYPQRVVRRTIFRNAFRAAGFVSRMLGVGR
jgi:hypothetical protein